MPQPFPAHKLGPYLPQIRRLQPANQEIVFCPSNWNSLALRPYLRHLLQVAPELAKGKITRGQVRQVGVIALRGDVAFATFFLASMIWGYGMVGYGRFRTEKMFSTKKRETILTAVRDAISRGDILSAYSEANLSYCGPAFFTKLFYFLGLVFKSNPLPLILDSRVSANLLKCNGNGFEARNYFRQRGAGRFATGYLDYVMDTNQWARDHNFKPDQLELFLFCPPLNF